MWSALIPSVEHLVSKTVPFKFRGMEFSFDLSHGLFSSAGVDQGTKLLLKIFSQIIDQDAKAGLSPPRFVLDSGCGAGIIGICAAAALPGALVRCQDRDELARLFTLRNAAKNLAAFCPPSALEACAEPLLAGPPETRWDLILTNIPAKAGLPVLKDFVFRSAGLLKADGKTVMVAVNTLADFFREQIAAAGAPLLLEHKGPGHTVFVYGSSSQAAPVTIGADKSLFADYPFYLRAAAVYNIEKIPFRLETIHGASGFDSPGGAVLVAAKLAVKLAEQIKNLPRSFTEKEESHRTNVVDSSFSVLVHEPGQGFFPRWLVGFLQNENIRITLSGRNILALQAARHNTGKAPALPAPPEIVAAADLQLGLPALLEASGGRQYALIAAFPELLPQSSLPKKNKGPSYGDQLANLWESLPPLLAPGGILLAAFSSTDAERFDRIKPPGFTRQDTVKRNGFRALAYRRTP